MDVQRAVVAGVLGALVMAIGFAAVRAGGVPANLALLLGTLPGLEPSVGAWVMGFCVHLVFGAAFGLAYAWVFESVTHASNATLGVVLSIGHVAIAGLALGLAPAWHPMVPEAVAAPGPFMAGYGALGVGAFVVLHGLYGAIVGAVYGPAQAPY